jgi:protein-tyrosine phosphatase
MTPPANGNHVYFDGARNFRDLGGYATRDGRRVRSGLLYRSDDLSRLTREDLKRLAGLGLVRVYDLRWDEERENRPNRLPPANGLEDFPGNETGQAVAFVDVDEPSPIEVFEIPIYYEPLDRNVTRQKIVKGQVEQGEFHRLLVEENRAFALDYRDEWARLIREMATPGSLPALIHCAEGKDRTGFATAILLLALGVPRETVFEDYILSNDFLGRRASFLSRLAWIGSWFRTPAREVRPLLEVRREYLEAGLAQIDATYGGIEAYLEEGLGIDDATLRRLRRVMLE